MILLFPERKKSFYKQQKKMCAIYSDGTIVARTIYNRFVKFRSGNFDVEYQEYSKKSAIIDNDQIKILVKYNPRYMRWDILRGTPHILCKCCKVFKI